jgi:uncharacterized protein (TIGR02265 family)
MPPPLHSVTAYLDTLPGGVDAHPDCCVKASLVRNAMGEKVLGPEVSLPAPVRALVDHPPPVTVWIPEVHFNVMMLAVREAHFGARDSDYLAWVYEQNKKLLSTTLYRAIFLVVSPERLLVGFQKRWASFRQGTEVSHVRRAPREVELYVRAPPFLYAPPIVRGMTAALRAAITCAGAVDADVQGEVCSSTEVLYRLRWR